MKFCSKCGLKKPKKDFYTDNSKSDNLRPDCKVCWSIKAKKYRQNNREKVLQSQKSFRENNKEKIAKWEKSNQVKKYRKEYRLRNKSKLALYRRKKYHSDINVKLACLLRTRIRKALKRKSLKTLNILGCSVENLKVHIESQFQPGMTWENWSHDGWHIDHIIPLSRFDLSDKQELLKACHYTNLQPLWAEDNWKKK